MTGEELDNIKGWINSVPLFFQSKLFTLFWKNQYIDDRISSGLNLREIELLLKPFQMFEPKDIKLILIIEGSPSGQIFGDDYSGLGNGLAWNREYNWLNAIKENSLRNIIKKLYHNYNTFTDFTTQFDLTLSDWATQGVLILNEYFVDDSFGFSPKNSQANILNRILLKKLLEEIHSINDKIPIALNSISLDYIKTYNINQEELIISNVDNSFFREINMHLVANHNYNPIDWFYKSD